MAKKKGTDLNETMEYWMGEQVLVTKAETPQQFYHEQQAGHKCQQEFMHLYACMWLHGRGQSIACSFPP